MNKPYGVIDNEKGSVIVLSLLVLVILSIVGFSASRTSNTEMQIVRNDATFQQNFYLAESGAVHAGQLLSNLEADDPNLKNRSLTWLNWDQDLDADSDGQVDDVSTWFASGGGSQTANTSSISDDNSVEFAVVDRGVSSGNTLDATDPKVINYSIVGIGDRGDRGQISIEIGYRKIVYP